MAAACPELVDLLGDWTIKATQPSTVTELAASDSGATARSLRVRVPRGDARTGEDQAAAAAPEVGDRAEGGRVCGHDTVDAEKFVHLGSWAVDAVHAGPST